MMMLMNAWVNPLPEMIERFTKSQEPKRMTSLIEFLTILPEEVCVYKCKNSFS